MSSSSRARGSHERQRIQAAAPTCHEKDVKVGLTDTFWNRVSSARTVACRCIAERRDEWRRAEMRNVASIGWMSNSVTRDLIDWRSMTR
jgi:hypothetical protein